MTVRDVREVLGARVLAGEEHLDREVRSACGSDMMSDVLAFIPNSFNKYVSVFAHFIRNSTQSF